MTTRLRIFTAALLVAATFTLSGAQEAKPEAPETYRLRGLTEVKVDELMRLYSAQTGRPIIVQPKTLPDSVSVLTGEAEKNAGVESLLRTTLAQYRLALVQVGEFDQIVPTVEALTWARTVKPDEVKQIEPLLVVRTVVTLKHMNANAVAAALRNLSSRQGGLVQPIVDVARQPGALLICDYAENVRELLAVVELIDQPREKAPDAMRSEVITLKHTQASDIMAAVQSACGDDVKAGVDVINNRVVISGSNEQVQRVTDVVNKLDQPKAK